MSHDQPTPVLTVALVTPDAYEGIKRTLHHVWRQTIRDQLEVVIVAPAADRVRVPDEISQAFLACRIVGFGGPITTTPPARALCVHVAHAPIVAFVENHAYPAPDWAEALVEAHRQDVVAVGPGVANANPRTLTSWVNLVVDYAPWLDPAPPGPVEMLPGHNCSYKREPLLAYGDTLAHRFDAEGVMHWDLRARGYTLYQESRARVYHLNCSGGLRWLWMRFNGGRVFAAARTRSISRLKRLVHAGGSPLIPWIRLRRILRELHLLGRPRRFMPKALPLLVLTLCVDGLGELTGYLAGMGNANEHLTYLDLCRHEYLDAIDRRELSTR